MFRLFLALLGVALAIATAGCLSPPDKAPQKAEVATTEFFTLSSPDFTGGGPLPAAFTCNAAAKNPELDWSNAPDGTQTYALVLKDITVTARMADAATTSSAYYWALWNIPADTQKIPQGVSAGTIPPELMVAEQWSKDGRNGYAPPCPNAELGADASTRVNDHFAFTLYALPTTVAAADIGGTPNDAEALDRYVKTLALHSAELLFTSDAAPETGGGGASGATSE